jgi:hypothetical protein
MFIALPIILLQTLIGIRPFDDAYITYRYAWNLAQGIGFVYNAGEHVLGTTTPLFALLLAVGGRLISPDAIPLVSFVISVACDIVSGFVLFRLTQRLFSSAWPAWAITLVWLTSPLRLDVAGGGMETALFTMLLLLGYAAYLCAPPRRATALFFALALLTRPEAILAIALVGLHWLLHDWRRALKALIVGLIVIAPWLVWATLYFGNPLPNSVLAKNVAYAHNSIPAISSLITFFATGTIGVYSLTPFIQLGFIASALIYLWGLIQLGRKQSSSITLGIFPALYAFTMSFVNAPLIFGWYYPPLLPSLYFAAMGGIWLWGRPSLRLRQTLIVVVAVSLVVTPFVFQTWLPSWILVHDTAAWKECVPARINVRSGQTILAFDIGQVGYCFKQAHILDAIGLVSPQAVPYLTPGARTIFDPRLLDDYQPEYIIAVEQWIAPLLRDGSLLKRYTIVSQSSVTLVGGTQRLMILERSDLAAP